MSSEHFYENLLRHSSENIYEDIVSKSSKPQQQNHSESPSRLATSVLKKNSSLTELSDSVLRSSTSSASKSNFFGGFFRLRNRKASSCGATGGDAMSGRPPLSSTGKLQIIHNVDGFENVFKTNKTFDLNEIAAEQQSRMRTRFNSSDNCLVEERRRENNLFREFRCFNNNNNNNSPALLEANNSASYRKQKILFTSCNNNTRRRNGKDLYESADKTIYLPASSSSKDAGEEFFRGTGSGKIKTRTPINDDVTDVVWQHYSTSTVLLIESWMTSVKQQTIDYNENTILNVKSIPARSAQWFRGANCQSIDEMGTKSDNNNNNCAISESSAELTVLVEEFTDGIVEGRAKAMRLPPKPPRKNKPHAPIVIQWNNADKYETKTDVLPTSEIPISSHSFSNNNDLHHSHQSELRDSEIAIVAAAVIIDTKSGNTIDINLLYTEIVLSVASNRVVITYDRNLNCVLSAIRGSSDRTKARIVQQNIYRLLLFMWATESQQQNRANHQVTQQMSIANFEKRSPPIATQTKQLQDFEKKSPPEITKSFMDFEVKVKECSESSKKCIQDYVLPVDAIDVTHDEEDPYEDIMEEKLILRRGNYGTLKSNNRRAGLLWNIRNSENEEKIYQQIWNFHTVGMARDSYDSEYQDTACYRTSEFCTEIDDSDWELAEEFSFSTEPETPPPPVPPHMPPLSPFNRVHIYYSSDDPSRNHIVYNIPQHRPSTAASPRRSTTSQPKININFRYNDKTTEEKLPSCVISWKMSLRRVALMEDEEDVIMSDKNSSSDSIKKQSQKILEQTKTITKNLFLDFRKEREISTDLPPSGNFVQHNADESDTISTTTKNSQSTATSSTGEASQSYTSSSSSLDRSHVVVNVQEKSAEKNKNEKRKEKFLVFGEELEKADVDSELKVPRFVIECTKVIEKHDNITTNGIYRASGNKNSIEIIKKKINGKRAKDTKRYDCLEDQEVHTLTSALKLFFRETSDLIPESVFATIPKKNLEDRENLEKLRVQLNQLDEIPKSTLKFLIEHLRKVRDYSADNLMNSANLSIIWGATLFTKNVHTFSIMENEIMNRNVLIRVLIENYPTIFK